MWHIKFLSVSVIVELNDIVALRYYSINGGFGQHLYISPTLAFIPQILHFI